MKTFFRKFGYWIFLFFFCIGLLEVGARIYLNNILEKSANRKFQFSSYRVYEHVPGFTESDGELNRLEINAQGFRRSEPVAKEKPENTYRVFFLGGSAAHGISSGPPYPVAHVYQNETVDAHLERMLTANFPDKNIEVINAAVTGYQVFQHTQYLLAELLDYDPDLVIFFDGANDHYANNADFRYYDDFRYQFWKSRLQQPSIGGLFDYTALWMSEYSALFRGYYAWKLQKDAISHTMVSDMRQDAPDKKTMIKQHKKAAPAQFLRSINTNLGILKHADVDAILVLQPMLVLRDSANMAQIELDFYRENPWCKNLYPTVMEELDSLSTKWRVPLVDVNPWFNHSEYTGKQLLIDYCHLNGAGGEVSAKAIYPATRQLIEQWANPTVTVDTMALDSTQIPLPTSP